MRIAMFTNTYLPHVGGVANSVARFTQAYRERGHRALVVAPEFDGHPKHEVDVVRVPALQHFNGSDFSAVLPLHIHVSAAMNEVAPEVVHAHHPYLLGTTAMRLAAERNAPIVFTHHTFYEHYAHYVLDSEVLKGYVKRLAAGYANLCDAVIAPSESVAEILRRRGVTTRMEVIPTGADTAFFAQGDGARFRHRHGLPQEALVIGHVGRLAREKNLLFLARSIARALSKESAACALVAGEGPMKAEMKSVFATEGVAARVHFVGVCAGRDLADAYHAMDVFAFASKTETQGMVLAEAMAAGCPVVALDAPGARDIVRDRANGRVLRAEDADAFAEALLWVARLPERDRQRFRESAAARARDFDMENCVTKALGLYADLIATDTQPKHEAFQEWQGILRGLKSEWEILSTQLSAGAEALIESLRHGEGRE